MVVLNYLFIGVLFMFCIEFVLFKNKGIFKKLEPTEKIVGIVFWPICLGVFLYSFFKEMNK